MKHFGVYRVSVMIIMLAFLSSFCDKSDDDTNAADPANLIIEILSIDHETAEVVLQATALNTVQYHFYIGSSDIPEAMNETGLFDYTFDGEGQYSITVRAYSASGRYIKASQTITISTGGQTDPVPLSKGYFSPLEYNGYTLVWQDEFNDNAMNTSNWSFDIGDGCPNLCGWGNNELEYYRQENAWVADSVLTIEAREETFANRNYTSAKLISRGKKSFRYGRIDIRALLPQGKGLWPALWMLGNNFSTVGWPKCGEIDIMEMIGGNNGEYTCYGTIHWDESGEHASYGQSTTVSGDSFAEAYHVFSLIWDESSIQWLVDNQVYNQVTITNQQMSEFHQEFWFILNVAVGGNWPGNPDATTVFPQQMKVDYIRVFQPE
ncbi:MAG: glycoside hydrolase family 16 protein [Bacteroidales bacterium]|nr:glycoside hydrolase family 16 protein [Bacteroidales bacterium]